MISFIINTMALVNLCCKLKISNLLISTIHCLYVLHWYELDLFLYVRQFHQRSLLLTWLNFNPSMGKYLYPLSWWRHQMETFSALLAICAGNSPVHGEFPAQRPVTRSFDVFFDVGPNKRLSKQSWGWWFETLSPSLWRHRNVCKLRDEIISPLPNVNGATAEVWERTSNFIAQFTSTSDYLSMIGFKLIAVSKRSPIRPSHKPMMTYSNWMPKAFENVVFNIHKIPFAIHVSTQTTNNSATFLLWFVVAQGRHIAT